MARASSVRDSIMAMRSGVNEATTSTAAADRGRMRTIRLLARAARQPAQMAAFLVRTWLLSGRRCPADGSEHLPFENVTATNIFRSDIACLFALGVTNSTSATTYAPEQPATRAQVAALLARFNALTETNPHPHQRPRLESRR